tara:strand:- start:137 stop:4402 length:4266 start_codon:yes stop_codon:yes gene_type:complete
MTITHLFHISDIHLRTGNLEQSRYDEYISVFKNLINSIEEQIISQKIEHTSLICITGDVFHNKSKIENYGLHLFKFFISNLLQLSKVIIIPGNHDFRQDFPSEPTLLSSIIYPSTNLYYLDKTQNIIIDNIQFSTVSIFDTLNKGNTSGISSNLPSFPINKSSITDYKIALFHGSFGKTKFNHNTFVDEQNSYPLEWIQDFDFALLGDIHLRQKGTYGDTLYGYSGSLIQQNFGEEPILHGYYIWNLPNKEIKSINVYNDNGFLTLSFNQNTWNIKYKGEYKDINTLITHSYFPKKPIIRINGSYSIEEFKILDDLFKQYNIQYNINLNTVLETNISVKESLIDEYDYNDKTTWINDFQNTHHYDNIKKWILNPETLIIPESILTNDIKNMIPKIIDKNKSIDKEVQLYIQSLDKDNRVPKSFFIKYISWDYLLCFGKDCYFNFEKTLHNVVSINGKNATGKSSFFEIICYALYGEAIPSRLKKNETYAVVSYNKPNNSFPKSTIIFTLDTIEYKLIRHYHNNGSNSITYRNTALYQKGVNEPIKSGKKAIEIWLNDNICSLQQFLSLNMITQNLDFDLFSFKPEKQMEFLDEIFKISSIKNLKNLINETRKIYKYLLDLSKTVAHTNITQFPNIDINEYESIKTQKEELEISLKDKNQSYDKLYIDYNIYPITLFDTDLHSKISQLTSYDDITLESITFERNKLIETIQYKDYIELSSLYNQKIQSEFDSLIEPEKPSFDIKFIESEKKQLLKWFDFTFNTLDHDSSFYKEQVQYTNDKIQELYTDKPIKHEIDIDITNIDISTLTIYCNENPNIPKPTKTIPKKLPKKSLDTLQTDKTNTLSQINTITDTNKSYKSAISSIDTRIQHTKKQINNLTVIEKPNKSKEDIDKWFSEYNSLEKEISKNSKKYDEFKTFFNKYDELLSNKDIILNKNIDIKPLIDEYNSSQYEFNPDCSICCKQPWLIHKKSLETDYNTNLELINNIEKDIKKFIGNKNIDLNRIKYNKFHDSIQSYNTLSSSKQYYDDLKLEWRIYQPYEDKLNEYNETINQLQNDKNDINSKLSDSISQLLSLQSLLTNIDTSIESHLLSNDWNIFNSHQKLLKYNYQIWNDSLSKLQSDLTQFQSSMDKSIINDTYINEYEPRIKRYLDIKKQLDSYNNWKDNFDKLYHIILSHQIIEYDTIIKNLEQKQFYQNIIDLIPIHNDKTQLKIDIDSLQQKYDSVNNEFIKLHTLKQSHEDHKDLTLKLEQFNDYISSSYDSLVSFHSNFDKFKDNIYNNHILPTFVQNINNNIINASSQFSIPTLLQAEVSDNLISWTIRKKIKDEFIQIPIQKASGFQRFIISLSFRITLINNSFKQFFIDEGFVHCDDSNRQMVPDFLYKLSNQFSYSIILVSHLSDIKDNINQSVDISVTDDFNYIKFS